MALLSDSENHYPYISIGYEINPCAFSCLLLFFGFRRQRWAKAYSFDVDEVEIFRRDDEIILRKKRSDLSGAFQLLADMPSDFFADGRCDPAPEALD